MEDKIQDVVNEDNLEILVEEGSVENADEN